MLAVAAAANKPKQRLKVRRGGVVRPREQVDVVVPPPNKGRGASVEKVAARSSRSAGIV